MRLVRWYVCPFQNCPSTWHIITAIWHCQVSLIPFHFSFLPAVLHQRSNAWDFRFVFHIGFSEWIFTMTLILPTMCVLRRWRIATEFSGYAGAGCVLLYLTHGCRPRKHFASTTSCTSSLTHAVVRCWRVHRAATGGGSDALRWVQLLKVCSSLFPCCD
jgi:hypothetical protein